MQKLQRLGFVTFLEENHDHYKAKFVLAHTYVAALVAPSGQHVGREDLFAPLFPGIELDDTLDVFCGKTGATAQYWKKWFTYLVIEAMWEELENEHETAG